MRKTIQIILICLTIVAFGTAAELLPALVNQLDERHTTGTVTQVIDTSETTSSALTLSYDERMEILSENPTSTVVFHTKKLSNVLDYDEAFLTNLQQQLSLLEQYKLISYAPSPAQLQDSFVSADYVAIRNISSDDSSCFYNWMLCFESPSTSSAPFTKLQVLFDPDQKLLYQLDIAGLNSDKVLANQKNLAKQLATYYSCKVANISPLYSNQAANKIFTKQKKSGKHLTADSSSIYQDEAADISMLLTATDKYKIHAAFNVQTGHEKKGGTISFYLGDFIDGSMSSINVYNDTGGISTN